jgi:hypothetical protein
MIRFELGLRVAGRVSQMLGELGAQRALDQRLLEPARSGFDLRRVSGPSRTI